MFISKSEKEYLQNEITNLLKRVRDLEEANKIPDYTVFLNPRYHTVKQMVYAILDHFKLDYLKVPEVPAKLTLTKRKD